MTMTRLLLQKRFGPFFATQFLGAFNDNVYKNALVILVAYRAATEAESGLITNLAAGLFILPYFLFSAFAGQLGDKYDKSVIIRYAKAAEIAIMALGSAGFLLDSNAILLGALFLMGTQSAFFGPCKYSILPQHLSPPELMPGNALVEMGTFLAILLGTLLGGLLAATGNRLWIAAAVLALAALGYAASLAIPRAPSANPGLRVRKNLIRETWNLIALIRRKPSLFNSVLGISWFWFFGATVLAQLPNFTQFALHADEASVTFLLAVFSVSVASGSLLCAKLSRGEIELGLVPLGALGLTLFCGDLGWRAYPPPALPGETLRGLSDWLSGPLAPMGWRTVIDLAGIGVSGSLFIVPLYALIQYRADNDSRSRVIAANNVLNALFMVGSALLTLGLYGLGFTTTQILLYTALLNIAVSAYIFLLIPEFLMRFVVWALAGTIYRMRYSGRHHVPHDGAALIVSNHVSFIDWFVITAACRRPVRFVMDHTIFKNPWLGWVFRLSKAIPIAPAKEDAAAKEKAFAAIAQALREGHLVCLFPEGMVTRDGELNRFRPGVNRILRENPVPVVPVALAGLWGSFFSRRGGKAMAQMPKPSRRVIRALVGEPMPPTARAEDLEARVRAMLAEAERELP